MDPHPCHAKAASTPPHTALRRESSRSAVADRPRPGPIVLLGLSLALVAVLAGCEPPIDPAIGVTTSPVTSRVTVTQGTFEGHTTYSYIPAHPIGLVYLFHGSLGSADFALKVDTVDVLNTLTARGYGFVATDSTERTGDKQWDVDHATTATNADLPRLERLQQQLVDTTAVDSTTPLFGIGMSNGSAFVTIWAEALKHDGYPVRAETKYMSGVPLAVKANGGVTVATQMVVAVNDTITNPAKEKRDLADIQAAGIAGRLDQVNERAVLAARYLRIPGISQATADAIVASIRNAGIIDSSGHRIVPVADLQADLVAVSLPASVPPRLRNDVGNQTFAMLALHQFNAEFKIQTADWFDAHRAG